jgi:spermidine/putrescine transport system permease protein
MKFLSAIFAEEMPLLFACPALLWQVIFLYMPLFFLMIYSVLDSSFAAYSISFTFKHYVQIFNSIYFKIILHSFLLAATTACICFLIGYPVAYFLAMKVRKKFRTFFLFSLMLPSWTSLIVQIYAWFFLLEKNGFLSQTLYRLGILPESVHLLNNYFSILVGMVSCFLPFMILPIYAVLEKMDKRCLEASADLGANRMETFRRVVFPLSLPGVYAGLMLVFIPSFGEFAIPTLLGGAKHVFWGNLIVDKFLMSRDWRAGSALTTVGILLPTLLIMFGYAMVRIRLMVRHKESRGGGGLPHELWQ